MLLQLLLAACLIPDGCGTHQEAIHAVVEQGVMELDDEGRFRTNEPATRLETAEAVFRMFDLPAANLGQFPDVDSVAADALATERVMVGFADGTFGPDRHLTRGQVSSVVFRAAHLGQDLPDVTVDLFPDVAAGSTHAAGVGWLVSAGAVNGFVDGTFRPHDPVSRGQLATLLYGQDR